jgi:hypothetical protein
MTFLTKLLCTSDYMALNDKMNNELEGKGREL